MDNETLSTGDLADLLRDLLDERLMDADPDPGVETQTFEEGGWLTREDGFAVKTPDGGVLFVTVTAR